MTPRYPTDIFRFTEDYQARCYGVPPDVEVIEEPVTDVPDWPDVGDVTSNCDADIDEFVLSQLAEGGCTAGHPAWEFHANVWFADGLFHERVMRYHAAVGQYACSDYDTLRCHVNDRHGWN